MGPGREPASRHSSARGPATRAKIMLQQVHACGPLLLARLRCTHLAAASGREASGVGAWQWEAPNHGLHPPPTSSRAAAEAAPTSAWYWKVSASVVAAAAQMARRCWRAASLRSRRAAAAARVAPAAAAAGRPVSARRGAAAVLVTWRAAPACERGGRLAREVQGRRRARSLAHRNLTHAMHIIGGSSQRPQLTATAERAVGVARHCTILLSIHGAPSNAGRHVQQRGAAPRAAMSVAAAPPPGSAQFVVGCGWGLLSSPAGVLRSLQRPHGTPVEL